MKRICKITAALLAALLLCGCGAAPEQTQPSTGSTVVSTVPTEPPVTLPPITWMTFPADRALTAQQYFVYSCETGEFLTLSGELTERIYPASVTKLFTAYVALQFLDPTAKVTAGDVLSLISGGSSVADIDRGNSLTVEMLVEAMLLPSGNDAAYILAAEAGKVIKGDSSLGAKAAVNAFVAEMNSQAALLGMKDTHFANPDGIHSQEHYTTFADLAILGTLSLEDPTIMKYARVSTDTVTFASGESRTWKNTNALIDPQSDYYCPYTTGLKTGQTPYAGSCLLSSFEYNGVTLVIGVFACPEETDRFDDTLQLFNRYLQSTYPELAG